MATTKSSSSNPGMMLVITYAAMLAVNAVVIGFANTVFPDWVVLGTGTIPWLWAIFHSAGKLALIGTFTIPFIQEYEKRRGKAFDSKGWMIAYFVINLAGVWLIARFPDQFGLGIRSWLVALVLAGVLDFVQGMVMMQMEKVRSKFS